MAIKRRTPRASVADGAPATDPAEQEPKPRRTTVVRREQRIQAIQERADRLRAMLGELQGESVGWHHLVGSHADAPEAFEEAMRLGREWRESFRTEPGRQESGPVDGDT